MKALALFAAPLLAAAAAQAAPAEYVIDPTHTFPSFEADHLGGLSVWRGKFNRSIGHVVLDKAAGTGTVDITIDVTSIDFGLDAMNTEALGDKLFDAAKYPTAQYKGKLAAFVDGAPAQVNGELTLHGVTRPVTLKISSFKCMAHPVFKRELCGADAIATLSRDAFGIAAGKDYGFSMAVTLRIQVEALAKE